MSKIAKNFVTGALILSIAGILSRFLGIFFWIPLVDKIGDIGIGYYNLAFPIYTLFLAISYVGLPSAISKMVSERLAYDDCKGANKVFKVSFLILVIVGLISSAIMFLGTNWIIEYRNWSAQVKYSLWGLSLAPVFVSVMGAYRGYFQGMQNMMPTGVSQVVEQLVRVGVGIWLAFMLFDMNVGNPEQLGLAAGGASFGATAGAIVGVIILTIMYFKYKVNDSDGVDIKNTDIKQISSGEIAKSVFLIALPITLGSAVNSIISFIDSMFIVSRLQHIGVDKETATALFGQLSGKTMTLVNVPLTLSMAVALSILPAVSSAIMKKDKKELFRKIDLAIRFGMILGLPAAVGLGALAYPIFDLFYPQYVDGYALLTIMSVALIFMILSQIFTAILQGMGHYYRPIINLSIGAIIKAVMTYALVATRFQVNGAAIASIVAYFIYMTLNYIYIKKKSGYYIKDIGIIMKPLISSIAMGAVAIAIYYNSVVPLHSSKLATLLSIAVAVVFYVVMIIWTKGLSEEDLKSFPKGDKLVRVFKKVKLMA